MKELTLALERALAANDFDGAAAARRAISESFPETEAAAEASYKLGLDALFRRKDANAAAEFFRVAGKSKCVWSGLARSALGLILLRQGKTQQAIFELRKVASVQPATVMSASGWGLLVFALRETGQLKEAERARSEHKRVLAKLTRSSSIEDAAIANFMLGMEYKFDGDRELAKKHLQTAVAEKALPPSERRQAEAALREV